MTNLKQTLCKTSIGRLIVLSAAFVFVPASYATADEAAYTMTVIEDSAQGRQIIAGRYESAIKRMARRNTSPVKEFYKQTNLCVAYTLSNEIERAGDACDASVEAMTRRHEAFADVRRVTSAQASVRTYLAIALTNRGVLYAVNGEPEKARELFNTAASLESGARQPAVNLARLEKENDSAA